LKKVSRDAADAGNCMCKRERRVVLKGAGVRCSGMGKCFSTLFYYVA
jgi:hypothetical protein